FPHPTTLGRLILTARIMPHGNTLAASAAGG
ncbi:MAG: hypothetical protein QOE61_1238, partial [Micromonosporaceae bacterium]|nr:hypothetical protein [Micromonosporaceae bacterium]